MTTQATPSNTALGRRSSISPFFAPLQTLGIYLDRQQPESRESGSQESSNQESDSQEPGNRGPENQEPRPQGFGSAGVGAAAQTNPRMDGEEDAARETWSHTSGAHHSGQDDLLFIRNAIRNVGSIMPIPKTDLVFSRSEASSKPQASSKPEAFLTPEASSRPETFLVKEVSSIAAGREPALSSQAVRDAISRLAREARETQEALDAQDTLDTQDVLDAQDVLETQHVPETQRGLDTREVLKTNGTQTQEIQTQGIQTQDIQETWEAKQIRETEAAQDAWNTRGASGFEQTAVPGAAFEEVARRVWSEAGHGGVPSAASDFLASGPLDSVRLAPDASAPVARLAETRPVPVGPGQSETSAKNAGLSLSAREAAATAEESTGPSRGRSPDSRSAASTGTNFRPSSGSVEAHALAHDAGNLLSALRLYSDLLCFSGVLHDRHRHYADDLKLLSVRSEGLIARLVRLAETVADSELSSPEALPDSSISVAEYPEPARSTPIPGPDWGLGSTGQRQRGAETAKLTARPVANPAEALRRLRSLLDTISHGALQMQLGAGADLPIAVPVEVLERILVNLVANAAEAVHDGGAIRIRAGLRELPQGKLAESQLGEGQTGEREGTGTMVLTVDDSGRGMSEAQVRFALGQEALDAKPGDGLGDNGLGDNERRVNERGDAALEQVSAHEAERSDGAPAAGRRHGQGLRIVRGLVEESGGRLFIHSRPGTGTRVEMHFGLEEAARSGLSAVSSGVLEVAGARPIRTEPPYPISANRGHSAVGMGTAFANEAKGAVA